MLSDDDIKYIANQEGVSGNYLLAILGQENSPDGSTSSAGAKGRGQLLPATFNSVMPNGDINDPEDNVRASARYLKEGLAKNNGDFASAASYYYAGPSFASKTAANPGKKYGTNPDGSAGISIEDYSANARAKLQNIQGGGPQSVNDLVAHHFPDSDTTASPTVVTATRSPVVALSKQADDQLQNVITAGSNLSDSLRKNLQDEIESVRKQGELSATVKLDEYQQQAQKAGETSAFLSKLGINTSDLDSIVAGIATDMSDEFKQSQEMRANIDAKRSVGLFDDPMSFLLNQFTLPQDIKNHNAVIQKMASQKDFVDKASSIASNIQQVNAAKFTTVSMTGAQAAADLAREQATSKTLEINDKILSLDYNKQIQTLSAINARISSLDQQEAAADKAGQREDLANKKARDDERQILDDNLVRVAGKTLGMNIPDRKTLDKMPKDSKEAIEHIMANDGGIGKDPLESWAVLARGNYNNMPPAVQYQRNILDTAKQQAEDIIRKDPSMKTANPKQIQERVSTEMTGILNKAWVDPNYSLRTSIGGVVNNPYHVPDLQVMTKLPELKDSLLPGILTDYKKNFPALPVSDSIVLALAYENVGDGKKYANISQAASDVSNYYRAGVVYNNAVMRPDGFGMPLQTDYQVNRIDFTRTDQVMKYMLTQERAKLAPNMMLDIAGGGMMTTGESNPEPDSVASRVKAGALK